MVSAPFLVSAPGKVILFGEHAAVYGKPAIAAALSLRSYLLTTLQHSNSKHLITLEFPDIDFKHSWVAKDLPWDAVPKRSIDTVGPPTELHTELVEAVEKCLTNIHNVTQRMASLTFLYMYLSLCNIHMPGMIFSIRSTLPIGAGLGSSATVSVCLSTALCLLSDEVAVPEPPSPDGKFNGANYASVELIDAWSFLGERCMHGNPSGIDNAVAAHGGAVMFQRMAKGNPNVRETMREFPSLRLLLIDSKQPRRTAVMVANVASLLKEYSQVTESILSGIENLTTDAYKLLLKPKQDCDAAWSAKLRELVRINHGLLVSLGVSHPKLETIRVVADELEIGETKLTGAGGGGCAITLVNDGVEESRIQDLRTKLQVHGFEVFETMLGGPGVGCLLPSAQDVSEWESWEERLFSVDHMLELADREEVDRTIGVDAIEGWMFW
ncbi:ribosomal protein S5 domain 2-type protein [Lipomyces arxii]|uniref:ribosomal protein S5 domain 2-type protein n=1 Tax=Lipomyces arxii TaxID=56418 RepID=UPI0034CF38C8